MIRGRYVYRRNSVQLAVSEALERIISTKKKSSREGKIFRAKYLSSKLGQYDLRRVLANRGHQDNFQLNG